MDPFEDECDDNSDNLDEIEIPKEIGITKKKGKTITYVKNIKFDYNEMVTKLKKFKVLNGCAGKVFKDEKFNNNQLVHIEVSGEKKNKLIDFFKDIDIDLSNL